MFRLLRYRTYAHALLLALVICALMPACYIVRNAPEEPFVVSYNIINKDKKAGLDKTRLTAELRSQNEVFIKQSKYFGIKVIKSPPLFNSDKMIISMANLQNFLINRGYFHNLISYDTTMHFHYKKKKVRKEKKRKKEKKIQDSTKKDTTLHGIKNKKKEKKDTYVKEKKRKKKEKKIFLEKRVFVRFSVVLGTPYYLRSFAYEMYDDTLQHLVDTYIVPFPDLPEDEVFSTDRVNIEIDRIVQLAQNRGYVNISANNFLFVVDTTELAYHPPKSAKTKRTLRVIIRRDTTQSDSANTFKRYYLRDIYYQPNFDYSKKDVKPQYKRYDNYFVDTTHRVVRPFVFEKISTLRPHTLFSRKEHDFTIKRLLQTNIWGVVNFSPKFTHDTIVDAQQYGQFDLNAHMVRNKRFNVNSELGLSLNTTPRTIALTLPNRTLSTSAKVSFTMKNIFRTALETQIVGRAGIETIATAQPSIAILLAEYSLDILNHVPWLAPFDFYKRNPEAVKQTYFNLSGGITNRLNFYNLQNASFYYSWLIGNPKKAFDISLQPVQLTFTRLQKFAAFVLEEQRNPSLTNAFNQGFIGGIGVTINKGINYKNAKNNSSVLHVAFEESGATWGLFAKLAKQNIFQYLRTQISFVHHYNRYKSSIVYRFLVGAGVSLNQNLTLPFYKQFFAGGPNSMRAWPATRLGLGSSPLIRSLVFQDRYGDIKLETNLEYRFNIVTVSPLVIEGALFTDIGNIWDRKLLPQEFEGSVFSFRRLPNDIAIGVGGGLRFAASFLILRFDLGFRAKDPIFQGKEQWFNPQNFRTQNIQLQFGLGYPF